MSIAVTDDQLMDLLQRNGPLTGNELADRVRDEQQDWPDYGRLQRALRRMERHGRISRIQPARNMAILWVPEEKP